jgi:hypothetical protein
MLHAISAERLLAKSLLEYARLLVAVRLSPDEKDAWIKSLSLLANEIKGDTQRLELFKWVYISMAAKELKSPEIIKTVHKVCNGRIPFLCDHLTVTLDELRDKANELRQRYSPKSNTSPKAKVT